MSRVYIADKPTLDEVNNKIDGIDWSQKTFGWHGYNPSTVLSYTWLDIEGSGYLIWANANMSTDSTYFVRIIIDGDTENVIHFRDELMIITGPVRFNSSLVIKASFDTSPYTRFIYALD